jgi:hypothetical protein
MPHRRCHDDQQSDGDRPANLWNENRYRTGENGCHHQPPSMPCRQSHQPATTDGCPAASLHVVTLGPNRSSELRLRAYPVNSAPSWSSDGAFLMRRPAINTYSSRAGRMVTAARVAGLRPPSPWSAGCYGSAQTAGTRSRLRQERCSTARVPSSTSGSGRPTEPASPPDGWQ